jgi:O-antigen/teichoic acid export membrane protein
MKPTAEVFATKVADFGLRFVASVLVARFLGPTEKGVLTFALLVVTWAALFGNFGFTDAAIYFLGRREFPVGQAATVMLVFSVVAGSLYSVALFGLVHLEMVRWPVGDLRAFYLLLSLIPFTMLANNFIGVLQGLEVFKSYNFFSILRSLSALVAVLLAVRLANSPLMGIVYATIASTVVSTLLLAVYLGKVAGWRLQFSPRFLGQSFRYGLRTQVATILQNVNLRFDQFVLGLTLDPIQLGWYSIASSISELPQLLPDSIGIVLLPRIAGNRVTAASLTARSCRFTVFMMLMATAILVGLAGPLISLVYGAAFAPAARAFLFLAPSIVFLSISKILSKYMCGIGRPGLCIWPTAVASLVTVVLIYPMVIHHGMIGAAITSSIAYGVRAIIDLAITVKLSATRVQDFLMPRRVDFNIAELTR